MLPAEKIRVLYVDDEKNNLVAFSANFREHFEIFTASSAYEGLGILNEEKIHVVLTDQRMPRIRGVTFLELAMKKHPEPARILLTGYSDLEAIVEGVNKANIFRYIRKPWNMDEVMKCIREGYEVYTRNIERKDMILKMKQLEQTNAQLEFMLRERLVS